jgi:hypothetical protein
MANSLVTVRKIEQIEKKFGHKPMQNLVSAMNTFNCESQTVAIDSVPANIKATGTKAMIINGQPIVATADTGTDISASTVEVTKTAWAGATAYVFGDIRWYGTAQIRLRCTLAHTSVTNLLDTPEAPANEPFVSALWDTKWEIAPHTAVNAVGASITKDYDQWFLVTASQAGVLTEWVAGDEVLTSTGAKFEMPQVDLKLYCPVALLHILNATSAAFVVGTTDLDTGSITDTFIQLTGGLMAMSENWDVN